MNFINRIKWWYWRTYKSEVHHEEIMHMIQKDKIVLNKHRASLIYEYACGEAIKSIANRHNVTMERVRQIIFKTWRMHNERI